MRSAPSEQSDYISDRKKNNIRQSKINEHETPLDEILYDQFSVDENLDKQSRASTGKTRPKIFLFQKFSTRDLNFLQTESFFSEQSLLGWIELIENPKLYEAVKSLSVEDQIFISYIVKEGRTQRELSRTYGVAQKNISKRFNRVIEKIKYLLG